MVTITIFVRHSAGCKHSADEFSKRCNCRKHFRWTMNGQQFRKQAGTRSWAEAEEQKRHLEDELAGRTVTKSVDVLTEEAVRLFLASKSFEGISRAGIKAHTLQLSRLRAYAEKSNVFTVKGISPELLMRYCATWTVSSGTKSKNLKMLTCFLRYCYDSEWINRVPKTPRITVDAEPTEPLTPEEYQRLLAACDGMPKLRAVIQLMRHSGLAVRDASTLAVAELEKVGSFYRIVTARQKTGTHVSVAIPAHVANELFAIKNENPAYFFWHGEGDGENFAAGYGSRISEAFERAKIEDTCFMKSHRLRDTFAVELLIRGVSLEDVSKLLGHKSITTTERHYAKWVKGRQDRLDSLVTATWEAA